MGWFGAKHEKQKIVSPGRPYSSRGGLVRGDSEVIRQIETFGLAFLTHIEGWWARSYNDS